MSLLSTIAHDAPQVRGLSPKGIGMTVVGLVVAVGVVFSIVNGGLIQDQSEQSVAATTRIANEEFLRLNTTGLEYPGSAASAAVTPQEPVDPFIQMNTTALDGLVPAAVSQPAVRVDPFVEMNTTALDGLAPATSRGQRSEIATDEFLEWNVSSLEYAPARYSESASGPR